MTGYTEFLPNGGYPKLKLIWIIYLSMFVVFSVVNILIPMDFVTHLIIEALITLLFIIHILIDWNTVSIIISTFDRTLQYRKVNYFGKEKTINVFLPDAHLSYKYEKINKVEKGWCLFLYNGFFRNRVALKQDEINGYTKEQLDKMFELINQCRK